ncbi:MAG: Rrf2 family transcriptional regulator [Deltaproteobacteria bacterium]|nr:Rrf2 family transcriptional regulator [Deltaproteobacteria bacterium]
MLRLNKKTEYALLALRQLASGVGASEHVTARAIAGRYNIPEMLLAKVLQRLKRHGLVTAAKGSGGGYRLARPLAEVPLLTVLGLFDGEASLVQCQDTHGDCQQLAACDIRGPLAVLSRAILAPLERMSLAELFADAAPAMSTSAVSQPEGAPMGRIIRPRALSITAR